MKKIILLIALVSLISGCFKAKTRELKSPCVAIESIDSVVSPCVKRPANANWLS